MDVDLKFDGGAAARMKKLGEKLALLERDRELLEAKIAAHKNTLEERSFDVGKLDTVSLTAVFQKFKGSQAELVKDRAELFAVWLKYRQAHKDLAGTEEMIAMMSDERARLQNGQQTGDKPAEGEERIAQARCRLKEIEKAAAAGREVSACLDNAGEDLLKAQELGEASGGMLSSAVLFDYIHGAREQASRAQGLMNRFRYLLPDAQAEAGELARFTDSFFDSLMTDFVTRGQVHDSQEIVRSAQNLVESLLMRLASMSAAEREEIRVLQTEK